MFILAAFTSLGSALTGIGAQVALTPTINFMLGYVPEKSASTALLCSLFTAIGGAAGAMLGGIRIPFANAVLLAVGATLGALLVVKQALNPRLVNLRRSAQSLGMVIGIYVMGEVVRRRVGGPVEVPIEFLRSSVGVFLVGIVCGAFSNLFHLSSGVLLVPAVLYIAHPPETTDPIREAIATSLIVTALASFLPTLARLSMADPQMGRWMALGGAVGGLGGGLLLGVVGTAIPLVAFGFCAMFLSAWMLWKMS
jgi:uncharacterized membrane protein YfcA